MHVSIGLMSDPGVSRSSFRSATFTSKAFLLIPRQLLQSVDVAADQTARQGLSRREPVSAGMGVLARGCRMRVSGLLLRCGFVG